MYSLVGCRNGTFVSLRCRFHITRPYSPVFFPLRFCGVDGGLSLCLSLGLVREENYELDQLDQFELECACTRSEACSTADTPLVGTKRIPPHDFSFTRGSGSELV